MEIAKTAKQTNKKVMCLSSCFPFFHPHQIWIELLSIPCPVHALNFQNRLSEVFKLFYITDNAACLS